MGKGGFKTQVILLAVLFGGVCLAFFFLFFGGEKQATLGGPADSAQAVKMVRGAYPAARAVPLDAAAVICSGSVSDAVDLLTDDGAIFKELFVGTGRRNLSAFLDSLKKSSYKGLRGSCVISLHYDRDLEPLMIFDNCGKSSVRDRIVSLANNCQLETSAARDSVDDGVLIVSPSQSLIASSLRHLSVGSSILDDERFTSTAAITGGRDAIFLIGKYAPKFAGIFLAKPCVKAGAFFASYADVLAFTISRHDRSGYSLKAVSSCLDNPAYRIGYYDHSRAEAPRVLPGQTVFAVSITTGGIDAYIKNYKRYLDAVSSLGQYSDSAEKWARGLDVKEIAKAELSIDGNFHQILLIKTGSALSSEVLLKDSGITSMKEYRTAIIPYAYAGYAATQFGAFFSIPDEGFFYYKGGWVVIGSNKVLTELLTGESGNLEDYMARNGLRSGNSPFVYFDVNAYSSSFENIFDAKYIPSVTRTLQGTSGEIFTVSGDELTALRLKPSASNHSKLDPEAVIIPTGPFKVTDYTTGVRNNLSQDKDNNLILTDDNGSKIWSRDFPGKIAGAASELDYYVNGRIQFLVATGSKLYLLDRFGRTVKGFPSDVGKNILLGPDVYDFSGAHGYSAIVLHDDNTIGMYDMHGRVRQGWNGITCDEQIITLPELITAKDGKRQWKVTTKSRIYIFPLYGGDAVEKKKK